MEENFTGNPFALAMQIGDHLLLCSEKNAAGITWKTSAGNFDNQSVSHIKQEDLASGSTGISLFLLELFKASKEEKYLNTALEGIRWATNYSMNYLMPYPALMNGNMGIVLALLKANTITGHQSYLERALMMAGRAMGHKNSCALNYSEGISGSLIVLIRLYEKTNDAFILSQIHECFDRLTEEFHAGEIGIFWDQSYHHSLAYDGFLLGDLGIANTFLEAGRFFNDPSFFYWANQSIRHELEMKKNKKTGLHSTENGLYNYPDYEQAFLSYGQNKTLNTSKEKHDYTRLAQGALVFLKAGNLLQTKEYEEAGNHLLSSSLNLSLASGNDFSLRDGLAGLGDILMEINKLTHDNKLINLTNGIAKKICDHGISVLSQNDLSFITGVTGIGYFLLRHHSAVESVCNLKASEANENTSRKFSEETFLKQEKMVLEKKYPRTLFLLDKLLDPSHPILMSTDFTSYFNSETQFSNLLNLFPIPVQQRLEDVFKLEREKYRYRNTLDSPAHNHIKYLYDRLIPSVNQAPAKSILSLDPSIRFYESKWHWDEHNAEEYIKNFEAPENQTINIFWPVANDLVEMKINPFTHAVMACFETPVPYSNAFAIIKDALEISDAQSLKIAGEKFDKQIQELLANHILVQELTIN